MNGLSRWAISLTCMLVEMPIAIAAPAALRDAWSAAELQLLASMQLQRAAARPADPSNAYEGNAQAARLGEALFKDPRLSRNGQLACASCHRPDAGFEDGRPLAQGLATGTRRSMPVMGAQRAPFLFWDGRKDSLWSQALGPLENPAEQGSNRAHLVRVVQAHYAADYAAVFGALPDFAGLPANASPLGTPAEQADWWGVAEPMKAQVNRVFANLGKAIAAYESRVQYAPGAFDRYVAATLAGDGEGQTVLDSQAVRGLRLFVGKGQCSTCHNGPLFTDQAFHNTGVPPRDASRPDPGRAAAIGQLIADPFNCLGAFSDARPEQCGELNFLATGDPAQLGAFRTPSLRNVAMRAPYMHAGQFASLGEVIRHYIEAPKAALGRSELARPGERNLQRQAIELSAAEIDDLVAFLGSLSGPVVQP